MSANLWAELSQVEEDIRLAKLRGEAAGGETLLSLETEQARILKEIDDANKAEIVAEAQRPDSSFSLAVGEYVADFRALAAGEDEYQMLSITTQLYLSRIEDEHATNLKAVKESYESELRTQSDSYHALDAELDQSRNDLQDVRSKLENATNRITDLEIERDSAIKEAESLRKQVEELRGQIADKPVVTTNIDGASELAAINARLLAKRIPVYDLKEEYRSGKGTFTTFKLAETGEPGEVIWTGFKAKYREVTEEEAARFRAESEAAKAVEVPESPEVSVSLDPPSIEMPVELGTEAVGEPVGDGESESGVLGGGGEVGTVEERLAALEEAVFGHIKAVA